MRSRKIERVGDIKKDFMHRFRSPNHTAATEGPIGPGIRVHGFPPSVSWQVIGPRSQRWCPPLPGRLFDDFDVFCCR